LQPGDKIAFSLLKKETAAVMKQSCPGIDPDISQWKGKDITDFQEDLQGKVNGRLSEKWFYTHMKTPTEAMPRIDVLNMLSRYAGYESWRDFCFRNNLLSQSAAAPARHTAEIIRIPLVFIAVTAIVLLAVTLINRQNYRFSFFDSVTGEPVVSDRIMVELFMKNESPVHYPSDSSGLVTVNTAEGMIRMAVSAPYYHTDTVTRRLRKFGQDEKIELEPDSYALMISYFSESDVNAWEKRREQLAAIFSDDAMIYRLEENNGQAGMELYNKEEFIDHLTMPSSGLRKIEILNTRYRDGRIVLLRFRLRDESNE
jgi:hypothetical protein